MVDRHSAGQPVLSGPAALGLEEKSGRETQKKKGMMTTTTMVTTGRGKTAAHKDNGSGQLVQKPSGQIQKTSPMSEGVNL